ncbi:hypothetical protein E0K83_01545 [Gramella sp. BOM4]|nr:hypothetical protein [Christiangramia bathymodioli]
MNSEDRTYEICQDGMPVSDLIKKSSIKYISGLRQNGLILINKKGKLRLTSRGKLAKKMGLSAYMNLSEGEREFLSRDKTELNSENKGLVMVFGGLLLSFFFFSWILLPAFLRLYIQPVLKI